MRPKRVLMALSACLAALVIGSSPLLSATGDPSVKVWEEQITIPTYLAGPPEPNPMFFFGRQSQGAQGPVYPYPMYDTLAGKKVDKTYTAVYLENDYLRIGVLPEVGGRIFEGVDKTNNYNFIYRQHVIKPALIGLIGAWISGGVEWNIPHHHRASTFIPVQYKVEENADGSKTIWVGELEMRQRMRWTVGYTLRPGKAYLEASVRILNRTPVVNTMLCFANLAVHANENYQVIFPPARNTASSTASGNSPPGRSPLRLMPAQTSPKASISAGTRTTFRRTRCSPGIIRTTFLPAMTTGRRRGR